jgi:hypothetical protein
MRHGGLGRRRSQWHILQEQGDPYWSLHTHTCSVNRATDAAPQTSRQHLKGPLLSTRVVIYCSPAKHRMIRISDWLFWLRASKMFVPLALIHELALNIIKP